MAFTTHPQLAPNLKKEYSYTPTPPLGLRGLFLGALYFFTCFMWAHAAAKLTEALRYKPKSRGFDSRWCHWNFSLTHSFRPHYGPRVDSSSKRKDYQEYLLGVKAAGPYHVHAPNVLRSGSLNLLEPSGPVQACNGIALLYMFWVLRLLDDCISYGICTVNSNDKFPLVERTRHSEEK